MALELKRVQKSLEETVGSGSDGHGCAQGIGENPKSETEIRNSPSLLLPHRMRLEVLRLRAMPHLALAGGGALEAQRSRPLLNPIGHSATIGMP